MKTLSIWTLALAALVAVGAVRAQQESQQPVDPDEEQRRGVRRIRGGLDGSAGLVLERYVYADTLERSSVEPIRDLHLRIEGLPLECRLLLDLDLDLRANRLLGKRMQRRGRDEQRQDAQHSHCVVRPDLARAPLEHWRSIPMTAVRHAGAPSSATAGAYSAVY